jgi:molybdate transport system substrate-binding protein
MQLRTSVLAAGLAVAIAACSTTAAPAPVTPGAAAGGELQVYAAASLKAVLAKAKTAYETVNPGTTITIALDSSTALETKIELGAPADVFLSADTNNPQTLVDKSFASGAIVTFAGNRLTVIVPIANPAAIRTPADLAKPGVKVIACADGVPIQKYAAMLLDNLVNVAGYPADFAAKYAANVVSKEDNVGAIVAKLALDEGDAGIVYVTDAKTSDKVTTVAIPDGANVPAVYGGVVVKASPNQAASTAFLTWLAGPAGQAILATFGFLPAS